jgi:hypothetical protein
MSDVTHVDHYADRQAGYDRTIRDGKPAPARRRTRGPATKTTELPAPTAGKFFVQLVRGEIYSLVRPEMTFTKGAVVEVSAEVHAHLLNAIDTLATVRDRELGRLVRYRRKFEASPPYPAIEDHYPDCE